MNTHFFKKFQALFLASFIYFLVGIGVAFAPSPAFSCQNKVGAVCVDTKKKKTVKRKKVRKKKRVKKRKKVAPKPVVAPEPEIIEPPKPVVKTADTCVSIDRRIGGFVGSRMRRVDYIFRNICNEEVLAFVVTNPCYTWVQVGTKRVKRNRVKIKGGKRTTLTVPQASLLFQNGDRGVFANYDFSATPRKKRKKYPKWPYACKD